MPFVPPAPALPRAAFAALLCSAFAPSSVSAQPAQPGSVTVYRCVDARGKLALRDRPCPDGQAQSTRRMQRIVDPPRPAKPAPPRAAAPVEPRPVTQYVIVNAPRPMYACTTPDGQTYTSESPEGNPRWVPLWTLDYPVLAARDVYRPGGASVRHRNGRTDVRVRSGGVERQVAPTLAGYGAGTWVRDACSALPQQETCDRLRDRRDEVRRRAFNAQPSERARLDLEERGINARLAADCRAW